MTVVQSYAGRHTDTAECFVEYIKKHRNTKNVLTDIYTHLSKFTIDGNFKLYI